MLRDEVLNPLGQNLVTDEHHGRNVKSLQQTILNSAMNAMVTINHEETADR